MFYCFNAIYQSEIVIGYINQKIWEKKIFCYIIGVKNIKYNILNLFALKLFELA